MLIVGQNVTFHVIILDKRYKIRKFAYKKKV